MFSLKKEIDIQKLHSVYFSGDLCVDSRPAVRKSAGQTLFSTIAAHGALLHNQTWQAVLWQVITFYYLSNKRESYWPASLKCQPIVYCSDAICISVLWHPYSLPSHV